MQYSMISAINNLDKNMIKELIDIMYINKRITNQQAMDILLKYKVCTKRLTSLSASANYQSYSNNKYTIRISKRGHYNWITFTFYQDELPEIMAKLDKIA
ncbi:hypothetical protein A7K50_03330 [Dehalobacter sp. MCB1]|uniref:hypothetical protein n=1 Tax=Dehalobacter sp. MCB1 TaxID=1844756 RepID=UPI000E6C3847|nr:hypothetical protein [Dehalobacter sp. MCB1]RJE47693.1 hypothetical protein A7K50_03330 [Dehalobacter sp. MCB1]